MTPDTTTTAPVPVSVDFGNGSFDARAILAAHPTVDSYIAAVENDDMFKVYKKEGGYRENEIKAFYQKLQDAVKAADAPAEGEEVAHTITEEDLVNNPSLKADGVNVGDEVTFTGYSTEEAARAAAPDMKANKGKTDAKESGKDTSGTTKK